MGKYSLKCYLLWEKMKPNCKSKNREIVENKMRESTLLYFAILFFFFRAAPVAYGSSQARGLIRAAADSHGHCNTGSKPRLQPTPELSATLDP